MKLREYFQKKYGNLDDEEESKKKKEKKKKKSVLSGSYNKSMRRNYEKMLEDAGRQ